MVNRYIKKYATNSILVQRWNDLLCLRKVRKRVIGFHIHITSEDHLQVVTSLNNMLWHTNHWGSWLSWHKNDLVEEIQLSLTFNLDQPLLSPSNSLYLPPTPSISFYFLLSPSTSFRLLLSPPISFYLLLSPSKSFYFLLSPYISFHLIPSPFISLLFLSSPFISFHLLSSPFISFHQQNARCLDV